MAYELGILGAGNMAEAIVRGVTGAELLHPHQILAADVAAARREFFESDLGVHAVADIKTVAKQCKCVILSVKPQQMQAALTAIGPVMSPGTLIISIAAGVSTKFIEDNLGGGKPWRVIRTMPNTPMLVGQGMVAIAQGRNASIDDLWNARRIFESAADVIEVAENQIDAVTAVSGSGPAYFFYVVEQMIAAGVELGLTADQARALASKTALGAAAMLTKSPDSPQELRRKVTSPGGTTQAAITHMESQNVGPAIVEALKAAARRSKELGL